eukprot:473090_1
METFTTLRCPWVYILTMILALFFSSKLIASHGYNEWVPSSPTLPRPIQQSAVAYDSINNTIWILGDMTKPQSLIRYDIDSNFFTDYNTTALSNGVYGWGNFYTQIDNILYMIDAVDGNKLSTFNVNTAQFIYYYQHIDIPNTVADGCLASVDDALFVLGQLSNLQSVQILNLTTNTWIVSPEIDYLSQDRDSASCIVHPYNNALYAIG